MSMIERKRAIIDGINGITPHPDAEASLAADAGFAAGVEARRTSLGMPEWEAVMLQCLEAEDECRLAAIFPVRFGSPPATRGDYGDPAPDPADTETTVMYFLK